MTQGITTFLMFEGRAEEAMNFYVSLFPDSSITHVERYGKEGPGKEGSVLRATFTLSGQSFMCIDSPAHHQFTFTPAISLYVDCGSKEEIDRLAAELAKSGSELMPLDSYPFSKRFAWIADRFGVSWQLNLPTA